MATRTGKRKTREASMRRIPKLGYYFIVTDTKETEKNYTEGLRDSIPKELQDKLVIKVSREKTSKLVEEAINLLSLNPQYGEPWIVFDRDEIKDFDRIIAEAQKKNISVGWSNPCLEIWFHAYFGKMPTCATSVECCDDFERSYLTATRQRYEKSERHLYEKLCQYGNEKQAIEIAKMKHKEHMRDCIETPSKMCPCTTVYLLVEEIKSKVDR